jgi:tubby and related proteins
MRTKFTIYDLQPRREGAKMPKRRLIHLIASKQINPRISSGNVEIGQVSYDHNLLKTEVPRKMQCNIWYPAHKAAMDPKEAIQRCPLSSFVLINKIPRWHEDLHCWCLNFNRRVIVASVKNFQLISPMRDQEVILQFGKIKKDVFTMDYRQPLSAFQAFVICLISFGTK